MIFWLVLALFLAPFVYRGLFGSGSGYAGIDLGSVMVAVMCWFAAIGVLIGKAIS